MLSSVFFVFLQVELEPLQKWPHPPVHWPANSIIVDLEALQKWPHPPVRCPTNSITVDSKPSEIRKKKVVIVLSFKSENLSKSCWNCHLMKNYNCSSMIYSCGTKWKVHIIHVNYNHIFRKIRKVFFVNDQYSRYPSVY